MLLGLCSHLHNSIYTSYHLETRSIASLFFPFGRLLQPLSKFIGFNPWGFDYGSMMDPEPGRCRRTDGTRWRCSRNVVPDQKYCERHMHRGRQRSRKHVEASKDISGSDATKTIKSSNTTTATNLINSTNAKTNLSTAIVAYNTSNTDTNHSFSVPTNFQLIIPSSNTSNIDPATAENTNTSCTRCNDGNNKVDVNNDSSATPTTINFYNSSNRSKNNVGGNRDNTTITFISAAADKSSGGDQDADFNHIDGKMVKRSRSIVNKGNFGSSVSPGFGFSPKRVLQGGTACSSLGFDYTNSTEIDLRRCRRTDGKRWRCSKEVVPDQKYCQQHMHRGSKKSLVVSESTTVPKPNPSTDSTFAPPSTKPEKLCNQINLNISLSISITANPQQTTDDEASSYLKQ